MVEVLAFLFENFLQRPIDLQANLEQIARELPRVGFNVDEVDGAIDWLDETLRTQNFDIIPLKESHGTRAFTAIEIAKIDLEARGMIYLLENTGLITPSIRELIIDRVMALNLNVVGKKEMQWVLLFVMMNTQARKEIIEWIQTSIAEKLTGSKTN